MYDAWLLVSSPAVATGYMYLEIVCCFGLHA